MTIHFTFHNIGNGRQKASSYRQPLPERTTVATVGRYSGSDISMCLNHIMQKHTFLTYHYNIQSRTT